MLGAEPGPCRVRAHALRDGPDMVPERVVLDLGTVEAGQEGVELEVPR